MFSAGIIVWKIYDSLISHVHNTESLENPSSHTPDYFSKGFKFEGDATINTGSIKIQMRAIRRSESLRKSYTNV